MDKLAAQSNDTIFIRFAQGMCPVCKKMDHQDVKIAYCEDLAIVICRSHFVQGEGN